MQVTFFGKKGRMSALFLEDVRVPVTRVDLMPHEVIRTKSLEKDGYKAQVVGFGRRTTKRLNQPLLGQLKNFITNNSTLRFIREIKGELVNEPLAIGDMLAIRATSKGKGFAGVVRKWGFRGGPKTHGQSDRERAPGSVGQTTTPGRVYRGKKMAGRMGGNRVYVKNLKLVAIENEGKTLFIKGAIPGPTGTIVEIARAQKN